ncbi:alpha/beta fold hydrolase [Roseibium aggregatum]|uniref:Alpha/beta hydrolase n=1 Tax=Roseibium aggregatum TaxID=187304 RepID=A0A939E998_9HYPH|nr:alpha/beta hydrolase [Roseibium aggregatum]MBN9669226.1 alpha/beta hydrolase [Roseibium aggregatum]
MNVAVEIKYDSGKYRPEAFETSDGLLLTYRVYGRKVPGKPVILALPGLTRNVRDLDPAAAMLADTYRIYTLNLRGRDTSAHDPDYSNYNTTVYIRDIYEFWNHVGEGPVVLLGTSLGALLAMLMAEDHPDMLAGIVLNDLGATIEAEGLARIFGYAGKLPDEPDLSRIIATLKDHVGSQYPGLGDADYERMAVSMYGLKDGKWHHRYDDNLARALMENREAPRDLWAAHQKAADMNLPILSIRGVLSDVTARATIEVMRKMAPKMQAVEIEDRGHCPLLNEPASQKAIGDFMESLPALQGSKQPT